MFSGSAVCRDLARLSLARSLARVFPFHAWPVPFANKRVESRVSPHAFTPRRLGPRAAAAAATLVETSRCSGRTRRSSRPRSAATHRRRPLSIAASSSSSRRRFAALLPRRPRPPNFSPFLSPFREKRRRRGGRATPQGREGDEGIPRFRFARERRKGGGGSETETER